MTKKEEKVIISTKITKELDKKIRLDLFLLRQKLGRSVSREELLTKYYHPAYLERKKVR